MANSSVAGGHSTGMFSTTRVDTWWLKPTLVVVGLGFFGLYYFWAAWQASYYHAGPYTSPLYEPLLFSDPAQPGSAPVEHALVGSWPSWWPGFLPPSPAFLIALAPFVFRGSCYYYRKAYYRAFLGMPPACAVGAVPHNYRGETAFFLIQNLHRYTMYVALLFLPILFYGGVNAMIYNGMPGIGVGSIMIMGTAVWLTAYTLGCHSFRHLIGGGVNVYSKAGIRHALWKGVSWLNARHAKFAWISLYWFLFADVYVRLVSMGYLPDLNTWEGISYFGHTASHAAMMGL